MKGVRVSIADPAASPPVAPVSYRAGRQRRTIRIGDPCGLAVPWRAVLRRDPCPYCGMRKPKSLMNIDHVHPRIAGGEDGFTNTVGACRCCNTAKTGRPLLLHLLQLRSEVAA